jgi:ERCC4-type nuclease
MESSRFILALYRWWQKEWTDHTSHLARNKTPKEITLVRPSLVRRIASELPGIGWGKSQAVDEHFLSVEDMILASEKKWASIPGIGKKLSQNIVKCLKGDYL